ncbi:MAG: hypothetical protein GTO22_26765 [Gemmatimonadales bacterium]|nr:hypothetical protein [Gemmatimonadales bacterium]
MTEPTPPDILWLERVRRDDIASVGGKAANLGELIGAGFPVPPGFVVTAPACRKFFESIDLGREVAALGGLSDAERARRCAAIGRKIREAEVHGELEEAILSAHRTLVERCGPELVCVVRSSATAEDLGEASFAGQHGTYYYVDRSRLIPMISNCWASLWSEEAVSYRATHGIDHAAAYMAVVVQQMIPAQVSGVAFTVNPVTGARDEIVIESSWGMGAAIVDGRVTPDRYVLGREGLEVEERRIARKRFRVSTTMRGGPEGRILDVPLADQHAGTLSTEQAIDVARLAVRAEQHFGAAQDVEWAMSDAVLHVLQSRPVTVAGPKAFCKNDGGGKYVLFKPLAENFTDPLTPLTANLWLQGPVAAATVVIGGRIYFDVGKLKGLFPFKLADGDVAQLLYLSTEGLPAKLKISLLRLPLTVLFATAVYLTYANAYARSANLPTEFMDRYRHLAESVDRDPSYGVRETIRELFLGGSLGRMLRAPLGNQALLVNTSAARYFVWFALLKRMLRRYLPDLAADALGVITSGGEGVLSAETGRRIWSLAAEAKRNEVVRRIVVDNAPERALTALRSAPAAAAFLRELDRFLATFGHRALKEFEFSAPRWEEDPGPVLGMVRNYLLAEADPEEHERQVARRREELYRTMEARLARRPLERALGLRTRLIRYATKRVKYFATLRENSRFYWSMGAYIVRKKILRLEATLIEQGRLKCKDDIFFLEWSEVERLSDGRFEWRDVEERIAVRRRERVRLSKVTPPRMVGIERTAPSAVAAGEGDRTVLPGQSASPGHKEGVARVILDPAHDVELRPGEILVAPYTDPAWTPLFLTAGAAVVEVGSFLSHAGTVAREYGLPCVVDVADCTSRIRTGDRLLVDGDAGLVRVLSQSGAS